MEPTGKYWIPIFNYFENNIDVCFTRPKYVKAIKGKKTDKKDSKWIADLYNFDLVKCSFILPKDFRQLRELARILHRHILSSMKITSNKMQLVQFLMCHYASLHDIIFHSYPLHL